MKRQNLFKPRFKPLIISFLPAMAMAVFPLILVKRKEFVSNLQILNHERIHLRQQLELLLIPFYILYLLHYLWNLLKYRKHYSAYRNIVFEKEAYTHENDLSYLKSRGFWAWSKYF